MNTGRLEQAVNRAWYRPKSMQDFLLILALLPFAILYRAITAFRSFAYRFGLFRQHRVNAFVIVVGNISVGGTGKTPFTLALCRFFEQRSVSYGIVSRGYGGKSDSYPLEVNESVSAAHCGDEPLMIKCRLGQVPVFVGPDRVATARALLEKYPVRVIICDDGLQHYPMARDKEFVVVDGQRGFGNFLPFPAGPLREPVRRLACADAVVLNQPKGGAFETVSLVPDSHVADSHIISRMPDLPRDRLCSMYLAPRRLVNLKTGKVAEVDSFAGVQVHAVAGIGNPQRFFYTLSGLGIRCSEHIFPDHHAYQAMDFVFKEPFPIIMTEKDAVKCSALATEQMWFLVVEAGLPDVVAEQLVDETGQCWYAA